MQNKRLHTPEGVRDIYNDECEKKHYILDRMRQVIQSYGYRFIETPTFEFFDIFGQEVGTTPSKDLYKFFDREGNTLVLRPDMTPSIARAASKYFPIRCAFAMRAMSLSITTVIRAGSRKAPSWVSSSSEKIQSMLTARS